jgi:hypothetical protein
MMSGSGVQLRRRLRHTPLAGDRQPQYGVKLARAPPSAAPEDAQDGAELVDAQLSAVG